jgi:hypothetical protein
LRLTAGSTCRKAFVFADVSQTPPEGGVCFYGAHGMTQTIAVLIALEGMTPPGASNLKTPFETWAERWVSISNRACCDVLLTALVFFVIYQAILYAVLGAMNFKNLPAWQMWIGAALGLFVIIFPTATLFLSTVATTLSFKLMRRVAHANFLTQVESDARYASQLRELFSLTDLKKAKACLELKVVRNRNKLALFFGSPDKLALITIAGAGTILSTSLFEKYGEFFTFELGWNTLLVYMTAGIVGGVVGLTLGAISANFDTHRFVYQLELVNLALSENN